MMKTAGNSNPSRSCGLIPDRFQWQELKVIYEKKASRISSPGVDSNRGAKLEVMPITDVILILLVSISFDFLGFSEKIFLHGGSLYGAMIGSVLAFGIADFLGIEPMQGGCIFDRAEMTDLVVKDSFGDHRFDMLFCKQTSSVWLLYPLFLFPEYHFILSH